MKYLYFLCIAFVLGFMACQKDNSLQTSPEPEPFNFIDSMVGVYPDMGNTNYIGQRLKSTTGWRIGGNGTNSVGFNALPAGHNHGADTAVIGQNASFWTATSLENTSAVKRIIYNSSDNMLLRHTLKREQASCRCVRD